MTDVAAASPATVEPAGQQWLAGSPPPPSSDPSVPPSAIPRASAAEAAEEAARLEELRARARAVIARIDRLFGEQLDAVLHHPRFQKMEALWRGVAWLATAYAGDPKLKLRILDVRWGEMARDFERAISFDQSVLFQRVYNDEFGTPGGEPYGMLVTDHALWHRSALRDRIDDVAVATGLAEVAAAAFCPIAMGVDPRLAGLDTFDEIDLRQDLAASLSGPDFARFERLRGQPDSRFLAAVLPRFLIRQPYRGRAMPRLGAVYDEEVRNSEHLCWLSGSFALAEIAGRAMRVYRWPAAIRGVEADGGGRLGAPERLHLPSDRRGTVARFPTENAISEEQEVALNAAGFICLRQIHLTGDVAFLNVPSLHRPPNYDGEAARINAKMSAMLNYILCVSRFAHYVKVLARDWVGKYTDADQCQRLLQRWLSEYVNSNEDSSPEMRSRYPLREGRVFVEELPGRPGSYSCEIAIRPHYQLDQIASEFRLTTMIGRENEPA
jgi:type VI secretion system ImpC/EvpB family protein